MLIENERGAIEASTLSLLIIVSLLLLTHLLIQSTFYRRLDQHLDRVTCLKELVGVSNQQIYKIGKLNQYLRLAQKAQVATILIPGLQMGTMKIQEAKKLIKLTQYLTHLSYLKDLGLLRLKKCEVPPLLVKTPYVLEGLDLKRSTDELTLITQHDWSFLSTTPLMRFFFQFHLGSALKSKPELEIK